MRRSINHAVRSFWQQVLRTRTSRRRARRRPFGGAGAVMVPTEALECRLMLSAVAGDGFESGDFDGGSLQWASDGGWIVSGDASVGTDGAHSGTYHARLRRSSGNLERTVDVSGLTDVELQFSARLNSFEGSDQAHVRVSADGVNWTTLQTFVDGQDDDLYHDYSLSVPDLGDTLYVRFDAAMDAPNDHWYLDDITVSGEPAGPPQITISDAAAHEGGTGWAFAESFETNEQTVPYHTWDVARSDAGDFYAVTVLNGEHSGIMRIDGETGEVDPEFVAPGTAGLHTARELTIREGWIYVANKSTNEVLRFDLATGAPDAAGAFVSAGDGGLTTPRGVTFDAGGNLLVISKETNEILKYDSDGNFLEVFASGITSTIAPNDLALDDSGNVYVTGDARVYQYSSERAFLGVFADAGSADTTSIEFGPDGHLYVGNGSDGGLLRFNGQTGGLIDVIANDAFGEKQGMAFDDAGSLFVANQPGDTFRARVLRYTSSSAAAFTVNLSSPSDQPVTVDFSTSDGSALAGSDYASAIGSIVFAPGQTERTIIVPTIDDSEIEPTETFTVHLSNAVGAVIADAQGLGEIANDDAPTPTISYPDFSDASNLNLIADAVAPAGPNNLLRITPLLSRHLGGAWHNVPQVIATSFETEFEFQVDGAGPDGFAFVIQNDSAWSFGGAGGGLGYNWIANSLAIEFDTLLNSGDPDDNHIAIHTSGVSYNSTEAASLLASTTPAFDINDGQVHHVEVSYEPGSLAVYLDHASDPALTVAVDLAEILDLDAGRAWLGFTGVSGGLRSNRIFSIGRSQTWPTRARQSRSVTQSCSRATAALPACCLPSPVPGIWTAAPQ